MITLKFGLHGGQPDDEPLLGRIRSLFEEADPMPAGLVDRIRLSVALADLGGGLEAELARLTVHEAALARGAPEESRTITFDSSSLTIMIRIDANADGTVRIDGWLAPPHCCQVEITLADGLVTTDADADGRFAFLSVPSGTARIVVRPPERAAGESQPGSSATKTVITPAVVL
ncbi:MAG TPA: hypothetical protein VHZ33_09430 [Trebonia sp.]|nr:hypothetical protein [Trebonia sp.]